MTEDTLIQIDTPSQTKAVMNAKQEGTQKANIQTIEHTYTTTKTCYD